MSLITTMLLTTIMNIQPIDRPHLTIAIGLTESGMNKYAQGRAGERGAYQVIPRIHGAVPKDLMGQTAQHERIMESLIREKKGRVDKAIIAYNGAGPKARQYLVKVRKKVWELIVVGV